MICWVDFFRLSLFLAFGALWGLTILLGRVFLEKKGGSFTQDLCAFIDPSSVSFLLSMWGCSYLLLCGV